MNDTNNDITHLQTALRWAQKRRGFCAPNPSVGAVVVKEGKLLGGGTHWACGADHAEVAAIKAALTHTSADTVKGATLYVTLEPCCHQGKTPPCTRFIIQHQLGRIIYAETDSNPQVTGKGHHALSHAGIDCKQVTVAAITDFYRSYRHWCHTQRPWVTAKLAMSLDGKIAFAQGKPATITGPALRDYTHRHRLQSDAILTTYRTVQADNPSLNVRFNVPPDAETTTLSKPVYVLDSQLNTPLSAKLFTTAQSVILLHHPTVSTERIQAYTTRHPNSRCFAIPSATASNTQLDLNYMMAEIGRQGVHDLWVEAGGRCFQALVDGNHAQRALLYIAPIWLGHKALDAFTQPPRCLTATATTHTQYWLTMGKDTVLDIQFG